MINVFEPQNKLLRQFVDSIYVFKKSKERLEFTAYPSVNTPVGLFRNTGIKIEQDHLCITNTEKPNHFALACNQFSDSVHLQYLQLTDEIAINFKPLGFSSFTRSKVRGRKVYYFQDWDAFLPDLFNTVFATDDPEKQLLAIETFLKERYCPIPDEMILLQALELLNDTATDYRIQQIAGIIGIHYKQLYRSFAENIGCSPVHYRKLVKFRGSVISRIKKGDKARLTDICYDQGYTDQPYFIKQFREMTGERPKRFFKEVSVFGNDKVIFKID
jgi:AraC-like DNA-binding protein